MRRTCPTVEGANTHIRWKLWSKLDDLDLADDLHPERRATGLKPVDLEKTNLLRLNSTSNETVQVDEQDISDLIWVHTSACHGAGRRTLKQD